MPYSELAKNAMLDHLGTTAVYFAAFDGDPAVAGNELTYHTGGRPTVTWAAAAGGEMSKTVSDPVLKISGGQTVSFLALLAHPTNNFATSGWASANVVDEPFGADGDYTVNSATLDLNA